MLLVYAGLLARYEQMDLLERLRDKIGRRDGIPGLWLLVPGDHQALMDGKAVPVLSPGQRARIPESWLENKHRANGHGTSRVNVASKRESPRMIDRKTLLDDLQKLLPKIEADLLERSESAEVPDVGRKLREEYAAAQAAERTAQSFEDWRSDAITQVAAAWVLSCVFVRFLEDNGSSPTPRSPAPASGSSGRGTSTSCTSARTRRCTDRDYLLAVFDELTKHAATKDVFGEHNPIRDLPNWLSGDAAGALIAFFQKIDPNTGVLVHDFTDPDWDTRFLGDLYQDLSEAARKKYALLQTPVFVEEFILDRTLDPAIEEFGLAKLGYEARLEPDGRLHPDDRFKMIDPACGSGHFCSGSFARLVERWRRKEPGAKVAVLVQRALDSVHGVDLNPYAVAIARFRLLARGAEGVRRHAAERCPGVRDPPRLRRLAAARQSRGRSGDAGLGTIGPRLSARGSPSAWRDCCGRGRITRWSPTRHTSRPRIGR